MARLTYVKVCAFIMVPLSFIAALPSKLTYILVAAIFCFLACITILACVHIFSQHRSKSHNSRSLLQNYVAIMVLWIFGGRIRKRFNREANDCRAVQEKLLMEIVSSNRNTVFGREYNFESIQNSADFIKLVPLTTKASYKEYVDRIAKGEDAVLTKEKTNKLAVTSGTTGSPSMIPRVQSQAYLFFMARAALSSAMYSAFPETFNLQKTLGFYRPGRNIETTEGGIPKGGISNVIPTGSQLAIFSTPGPGFHILESHASYYVHLLFGLKDRNIGTVFSNLAAYTYRGFLELEKNWQRLVKDIEEGSLDSDLELDAKIRSELKRCLEPDKKRAEELRKEFQAGFDGIASRIWPNLRIILCVTTGRQELYATRLREKYTGDVPMYSALYTSSESVIGVNLWPKDKPTYLPVLSAAFFEFVPVENCHKEQAKTCLAEDLEVNSLYELVITTPGGLYRYRMGDVVRVARFHYKSPVFEFQYRRGTVLPCHMTEKMVYDALCESVESFKEIKLVDYTCAGSLLFDGISSETGTNKGLEQAPFHIVFVELSGFLTKEETCLLQEKLEEALCNHNSSYRDFRKNGEESPVFLYRVKQGTFDLLMKHLMEANPMTSPIQFKIPRLIKTKAAGKLLLENLHPQQEHMK